MPRLIAFRFVTDLTNQTLTCKGCGSPSDSLPQPTISGLFAIWGARVHPLHMSTSDWHLRLRVRRREGPDVDRLIELGLNIAEQR